MKRKSFVLSIGLVAGLGGAVSAQTASSDHGPLGQKTIQSISVKVMGCVVRDTEAGRYLLTNAILSGDDAPSTVGTSRTSLSRTVRRITSSVATSRRT
jgi:hypothetical protein